MNPTDPKKNIAQSQGIKVTRPDIIFRPRNKIEEAINKTKSNQVNNSGFLPPIPQKKYTEYEPLKVERGPAQEYEEVKNVPKEIKPRKDYRLLKRKLRVFSVLLIGLGILALLVVGGWKAYKNYTSSEANDTRKIIEEVGNAIELPVGEEPTVATIVDLEPLKNQPFFKDAKIGDKVLIFSKSKKAILYRPSEQKIIVVAPLNN